mgnify:CR=1 FL=1
MIEENAPNERLCVGGSHILQWIRKEETPKNSILRSIESLANLGLSLMNALAVEGFLAMGTAMGIGMVVVLIWIGWMQ